jgi:hypothetical protein
MGDDAAKASKPFDPMTILASQPARRPQMRSLKTDAAQKAADAALQELGQLLLKRNMSIAEALDQEAVTARYMKCLSEIQDNPRNPAAAMGCGEKLCSADRRCLGLIQQYRIAMDTLHKELGPEEFARRYPNTKQKQWWRSKLLLGMAAATALALAYVHSTSSGSMAGSGAHAVKAALRTGKSMGARATDLLRKLPNPAAALRALKVVAPGSTEEAVEMLQTMRNIAPVVLSAGAAVGEIALSGGAQHEASDERENAEDASSIRQPRSGTVRRARAHHSAKDLSAPAEADLEQEERDGSHSRTTATPPHEELAATDAAAAVPQRKNRRKRHEGSAHHKTKSKKTSKRTKSKATHKKARDAKAS